MCILQVLARFSPCCCRGRTARCPLPANFGREVCSPRAPSLVPLSSLPLLSLPKPICKQEFASCLVPRRRSCAATLLLAEAACLVAQFSLGLQPMASSGISLFLPTL